MIIYVLTRYDYEKKTYYNELYENFNDAKAEMWNKINFQQKIRDGVFITEFSGKLVHLSVQDQIGGPIRDILSYHIEEKEVHKYIDN